MSSPATPRSVVLVASLLVAAGCDGGPLVAPEFLPAELRAPELETDGWTRVERPGFAFRLPPGFENLNLQPIDSDAAIYESGAGSRLSFDYGIYNVPISIPEAADRVHRQVATVLGGRPAVLVAFRHDGDWVLGARWSDLGRAGGSPVSLQMVGRTADATVRERILASIHSVRFP